MSSPTNAPGLGGPRPPIAEMLGATAAPFLIGADPAHISLQVHPPKGPAASGPGRSNLITLLVENIVGKTRAPPFDVYLNVPAGEAPERHPELLAGSLALFGLVESSDPAAVHGGQGLTFTLDITDLVHQLAQKDGWNPRVLGVSFVAAPWPAPVPAVRVGRVSLYRS